MTEDSDEWKKLPTDQKCLHKLWRARAEGYKECTEKFARWDGTSSEFYNYAGLMKKFVTDPNELVRIQGVEAALLFVEHAEIAKKTCGEVVSGIVQKCFGTKQRLKELAMDVCLMFIEIDRNEHAVEELVKGFQNKQPKVVTACLETVTEALSTFGSRVIQVKPIVKQISVLTDHRDKKVREAVKALAVEMYRWLGPSIKLLLKSISAVMLKELEDEWAKADSSVRPRQTRFMRSQQDLKENADAMLPEDDDDFQDAQEQVVDAYDLLQPTEILSKLPKKFYVLIEANKWQERKEVLDVCCKLCGAPKIEPGDFGELVKALRKVVVKDANVVLVSTAAKSLTGLARGLRKKFQPFATSCMVAIFEKFKEKKTIVIAALHEAADAIFLSTSIQALHETCLEYLANKNPAIKEQTALFLARAFPKTKPSTLNRAVAKPFVQGLLKNIDHGSAAVRDATSHALGTMLKLYGEKLLMPFLTDVDKIKLEKIKEYAGKGGGDRSPVKMPEPAKAPVKVSSSTSTKMASGRAKVTKVAGKKPIPNREVEYVSPQEPYLSDGAAEEQVAEFLPTETLDQLFSSIWKDRCNGLKSLLQKLKLADVQTIPCQALIKTLGSGKQGWKDSNFHCLNEKFLIVENLASNAYFSKTSAEVCIPGLIEKISDAKCGKASRQALTAVAEATGFSWTAEKLLEIAMVHKNPKVQSESLSWLSNAMKEFGTVGTNVKFIIAKLKVGFVAMNPAVRTASFTVFGTMALFTGAKIRMFFENEKPLILQQIDAEIEKCKGQSPPIAIRGKDLEDDAMMEISVEDLAVRVNISNKITNALVAKLSDRNWKIRRVALDEVTAILNEAKFVEPSIGELAIAITARLSDSNKILIMTSLTILQQLSKSLGPHCKEHIKTVAPGMVNVLADIKPIVRQASLTAMNQWLENTSLSMWFEHEIMSSALSEPKHIFLRIELLEWMLEKLIATPHLTSSAKAGLEACVKHVYACCEDRAVDVRTNAQAVLTAFIYHLGLDKMTRLCAKLSQTSLSTILGLLDKAKHHVPARKSKVSYGPKSAIAHEPVDIIIDSPGCKPANEEELPFPPARPTLCTKQSKLLKRSESSKQQLAQLDLDPALIELPNGKEQRAKDEQKMKTLKWSFDVPRVEFVTQLSTSMAPCVSSDLATELFHSDFQHQLKAIAILSHALENQWEETVATLDLILRWITLRFYEKNTIVHMKCLEFLITVFRKLNNGNYRMSDYEAGGFIPHLIIKIGEPKENIRKDIRAVLHQITTVYSAGKVFGHLMHGLLTKNSRQKTECLDQMGYLISSLGIAVCQPTASKALREIATHIGDRDNGVRSAALNVAVCAYNDCGPVVYKYVGNLNEKDKSMLEERIKRCGRFEHEVAMPEIVSVQSPNKVESGEKSKMPVSNIRSSKMVARQRTKQPGTRDSKCKTPEPLSTDAAVCDKKHLKAPNKTQKAKASASDICSSEVREVKKISQSGTRVSQRNNQEVPSTNMTVPEGKNVRPRNKAVTEKKPNMSSSSIRSSDTAGKQKTKHSSDMNVPEGNNVKPRSKIGAPKKTNISSSYVSSETDGAKKSEGLISEQSVQEVLPSGGIMLEDRGARPEGKLGTAKKAKVLPSSNRSVCTVEIADAKQHRTQGSECNAHHHALSEIQRNKQEVLSTDTTVPEGKNVRPRGKTGAAKKPKISSSSIRSSETAGKQKTKYSSDMHVPEGNNVKPRSKIGAPKKPNISSSYVSSFETDRTQKSEQSETFVSEQYVQELHSSGGSTLEDKGAKPEGKFGTAKKPKVSSSSNRSVVLHTAEIEDAGQPRSQATEYNTRDHALYEIAVSADEGAKPQNKIEKSKISVTHNSPAGTAEAQKLEPEILVSETHLQDLASSEMAIHGDEEVKLQNKLGTEKLKMSESFLCSSDTAETLKPEHFCTLVSEDNIHETVPENEAVKPQSELEVLENSRRSSDNTCFPDTVETRSTEEQETLSLECNAQEILPPDLVLLEVEEPESDIGTVETSEIVETQSPGLSDTEELDSETSEESLVTDIADDEDDDDDLLDEPDIEDPGRFSDDRPSECGNHSVTVDEILNTLISTLTAIDIDDCLKCIHQLDEILKNDEKMPYLQPKVDQILSASCIQIRLLINRCAACISTDTTDFDGGDANNKVLKIQSLCKCLFAINLSLAKTECLSLCASQSALQDFIHAVSMFILDTKVKETLPNAERLIQVLNLLVANLFGHANSTYVMCAVLRELNLSLVTTVAEHSELALCCLWKILPMVQDFFTPLEGSLRPALEPAPVLAEIHHLYASLNSISDPARKNHINTMIRTIRALITKFCGVMGMRVLDEIQDIEGIEFSHVLPVIKKGLKSRYPIEEIEAHPVNKKSTPSNGKNRGNSIIDADRKLTLIMKKVGNYELSKQGLQELYDFKKEYPDYDVERKFSDPLFLSYISRSLQRIDEERKSGNRSSSNVTPGADITSKQQLEHVKMLRMRCGLPAESAVLAKVETKVHILYTNGESTDLKPASTAAAESHPACMLRTRPAATSTMDNLKRRLEQIKREAKLRN